MKEQLTLLIFTFGTTIFGQVNQKQNPKDFLPKDYLIFEKIIGDLNKDGIDDYVFIIKNTDENQIIKDEHLGELDQNRRGIIVLFNKNGKYELVLKNYNCFSSENEKGGVYYAPELSVEIEKGNLYLHYEHGRYGYWRYIFRYQKSNFELIGYDASDNNGPVAKNQTSINFSTKIKKVRVNTNENIENGEETFKTTTTKIKIDKLLTLSNIKDFDKLEVDKF